MIVWVWCIKVSFVDSASINGDDSMMNYIWLCIILRYTYSFCLCHFILVEVFLPLPLRIWYHMRIVDEGATTRLKGFGRFESAKGLRPCLSEEWRGGNIFTVVFCLAILDIVEPAFPTRSTGLFEGSAVGNTKVFAPRGHPSAATWARKF